MFELFQFSIFDMTPYSRQIYFDMFGLYNQKVWPIHIPAMLMTLWLLYICFRPEKHSASVVFMILSVAWLWNGWVFHIQYYSDINWAGEIFGYLFVAQGIVLLAVGSLAKMPIWKLSQSWEVKAGRILLILVVLLSPIVGLLEGRTLAQLGWFAITPTPTFLGTLAFLLFVKGRVRYGLAAIPLLWGFISAGFAWSLKLLDTYAILIVLCIWLIIVGKKIIKLMVNKFNTMTYKIRR